MSIFNKNKDKKNNSAQNPPADDTGDSPPVNPPDENQNPPDAPDSKPEDDKPKPYVPEKGNTLFEIRTFTIPDNVDTYREYTMISVKDTPKEKFDYSVAAGDFKILKREVEEKHFVLTIESSNEKLSDYLKKHSQKVNFHSAEQLIKSIKKIDSVFLE